MAQRSVYLHGSRCERCAGPRLGVALAKTGAARGWSLDLSAEISSPAVALKKYSLS